MSSMRTLFLLLAPLAAACGVAPPDGSVDAGPQAQPAALAAAATPVTWISPGTLALSISGPSQATAGAPLVLTALVQNTSPLDASGAVLNVTVPVGSRIGGHLPLECVKTRNYLVSCAPGTVPGLGSYTLEITVTPDVPGLFYASAFTSGSFTDGTSDVNSVQAILDVLPGQTDLQISGSASDGSPVAGSGFSYTFQVKNSGPGYTSGVTVVDALPASLRFSSAFTSAPGGGCTASGGIVTCELGDLAVGAQATVTIFAFAPLAPAIVDNTATVSTPWGDARPANDAATVTVKVR